MGASKRGFGQQKVRIEHKAQLNKQLLDCVKPRLRIQIQTHHLHLPLS